MSTVNYHGYQIDKSKIDELAKCNRPEVAEYYQRVQSFLYNISNEPSLTFSQEQWLERLVKNTASQYAKVIKG